MSAIATKADDHHGLFVTRVAVVVCRRGRVGADDLVAGRTPIVQEEPIHDTISEVELIGANIQTLVPRVTVRTVPVCVPPLSTVLYYEFRDGKTWLDVLETGEAGSACAAGGDALSLTHVVWGTLTKKESHRQTYCTTVLYSNDTLPWSTLSHLSGE